MVGKTPDYRAVTRIKDKLWNKIGAAWIRDEKISVQLNMTPTPNNGKINFLLVPYANTKTETAEE